MVIVIVKFDISASLILYDKNNSLSVINEIYGILNIFLETCYLSLKIYRLNSAHCHELYHNIAKYTSSFFVKSIDHSLSATFFKCILQALPKLTSFLFLTFTFLPLSFQIDSLDFLQKSNLFTWLVLTLSNQV